MSGASLRRAQAIDFRGHDEVGFGEAVDFVRPHRDLGFAPGQQNVGMMALFFGERADAIDEFQRTGEVGEAELAVNVMFVGDRPVGNALVESLEFFSFEWGDATTAGDAFFVGEFGCHEEDSQGVVSHERDEGIDMTAKPITPEDTEDSRGRATVQT